MANLTPLDNIRIVLVHTSHPGNIGAAARAMKNMGLKRLMLVAPKQFPDPTALFRSCNATDIVKAAQVVPTLEEAIADCGLVVGTSARNRSMPWPIMDAREAATTIEKEAGTHEVAIVFGREDRGLTNEELQRCNFHLQIPTNEDYSSLNLAAAVQVVSYELRMAALGRTEEKPTWSWGAEWDEPAATQQELTHYFAHLDETLKDIGVINPDSPRQLLNRLRRLYLRARPDRVEINLLRGILSATRRMGAKKD